MKRGEWCLEEVVACVYVHVCMWGACIDLHICIPVHQLSSVSNACQMVDVCKSTTFFSHLTVSVQITEHIIIAISGEISRDRALV